jgi:hypothetical protein
VVPMGLLPAASQVGSTPLPSAVGSGTHEVGPPSALQPAPVR